MDLFSRIEYFFRRLEIYAEVPPTTVMTGIAVDIVVEVLKILGIATKEVKRGLMSELISRAGLPLLTRTLFREIFEEVDGKHRHRRLSTEAGQPDTRRGEDGGCRAAEDRAHRRGESDGC